VNNPYKTLGIEKGASQAEIKKAYFKQIRENPPETHPREFKKIRGAYEMLKDEKKRTEVDLFQFQDQEFPCSLSRVEIEEIDMKVEVEDILKGLETFSDLNRTVFEEDYTSR